jgi:hypothetical protein
VAKKMFKKTFTAKKHLTTDKIGYTPIRPNPSSKVYDVQDQVKG